MAIRWLEAHVKENNRQEAPTKEQLEELDCLKDSDKSEENMDHRRLMPWFRISMTAWLYEYAKKHVSKTVLKYDRHCPNCNNCSCTIVTEQF